MARQRLGLTAGRPEAWRSLDRAVASLQLDHHHGHVASQQPGITNGQHSGDIALRQPTSTTPTCMH
ncbi:hypothetical protein E2562_025814 [Oryza meyeriana var. granulata]|uniref:Uncharacterized protein n=1 Tax=Oryza meyeriana var. granulata TaxID=110450 RepID=A0A6G1E1L4_9ORYZ|nr:hypothetical protein E2562_025814 [Oryza meyeriana var. granulata]